MAEQLQLSTGDSAFEKLNTALGQGVSPGLRSMLNAMPAPDIAHLLESSPPKVRSLLWRLVEDDIKGDVLQELSDEVSQFFLRQMNIEELEAATRGQDADDIADLLQQLPDTITQKVLDSMDSLDRLRVEAVLSFPEDTAGGLMDTDVITIRPSHTLDVVLRYLRRHDEIPPMTDKLFVVNRRDEYIGFLPLTLLLNSSPDSTVLDVMQTSLEPIRADEEARIVAQIFERQDLVTMPVVSDEGKLLGRITVDDVVSVIREEAEHSLLSMSGLDDDEDTFAPTLKTVRSRAVWLGVNLITALIAASVIGLFQETIDKVVALAVLMPIVAGMGGNAGGQALTVVVRGMALGQISRTNLRWLLTRELSAGLINGLLWAVLVSVIVYLWFGDPIISLVIASAMVINITVAVVTGAGLPVLLKSLGVDPALAGTIVLTTVSDVIGFLSFLGLAALFFG